MSWEEFCKNNKMGIRFYNASLENCVDIDECLVEVGRLWIEKPTSLIIHGKSGRGKTYFSISLMKAIFDRYGWSSLRWFKSKPLDDLMIEAIRTFGNVKDAIESICDVSFLFIDDFGTETAGDHIKRDYFQLIDHRWSDSLSTILTTNLTSEEIRKTYGERIFSRFKDYEWIEFNGQDLRGKT